MKLDVRFTFKLELVGEIKMYFEILTLNCFKGRFLFFKNHLPLTTLLLLQTI